ncbi:MAG: hypothetical protein K2X82_25105 [Gemmataceae bacterium]|nr:hypothetical protein [Gemmataceae bacterium]
MSPSPAPPKQPPPRLVDGRANPPAPVPAAVVRGLPPDRLGDVERAWEPARDALAVAARAAGVPLEHDHWRWTRKDPAVRADDLLLVAVEAGGEVQGLMAVQATLRPAVRTPGRWVLYVDYIEAAPWNLKVPGVQTRRYKAVGTLLIGEAVRLSMGRAAGGRIGLHSLPGVEGFYEGECGMTRVGPDPLYHDLVYFEYPDGVAAEWLTARGLSA